MPKGNAPKLTLGVMVITPGARLLLTQHDIDAALSRHESGDWGDVCEFDRLANDEALQEGARVLSVYRTREGLKFWIITEYDRSVTTILMPDEY